MILSLFTSYSNYIVSFDRNVQDLLKHIIWISLFASFTLS